MCVVGAACAMGWAMWCYGMLSSKDECLYVLATALAEILWKQKGIYLLFGLCWGFWPAYLDSQRDFACLEAWVHLWGRGREHRCMCRTALDTVGALLGSVLFDWFTQRALLTFQRCQEPQQQRWLLAAGPAVQCRCSGGAAAHSLVFAACLPAQPHYSALGRSSYFFPEPYNLCNKVGSSTPPSCMLHGCRCCSRHGCRCSDATCRVATDLKPCRPRLCQQTCSNVLSCAADAPAPVVATDCLGRQRRGGAAVAGLLLRRRRCAAAHAVFCSKNTFGCVHIRTTGAGPRIHFLFYAASSSSLLCLECQAMRIECRA